MRKLFGAALLTACFAVLGCDANMDSVEPVNTPDTTMPGETMPGETLPGDTLPGDTLPGDTLTDPGLDADVTPETETIPQE